MDSTQVAVSGSLYKSVLAMIKELKKLILKWASNWEACSPSLIQMFEGTKRRFMDQIKIHFAESQKRYLQWRWRTAKKMFLQFKDSRALTNVDPPLALPAKKRQRKCIKIVELSVIPE
jgi:hypothetical protein